MLDLNIIAFNRHELRLIESFIEKHATHHNGRDYHIVTSFPILGRILALTILYEVGDIDRSLSCWVMLQPVSRPLQSGLRLFRPPKPASP
ncbi:hypothetical protein [Nitrincola alkalisediminis]|uniref:hypothetical protein n=1 Tax=Nitrincola alkalisediminis TaxID=1366656 RepID=UPI001877016E|nr:hypothetical protein [Nitrincola alkalisediminis]